MKKRYNEPHISKIVFEAEDIIRTSGVDVENDSQNIHEFFESPIDYFD